MTELVQIATIYTEFSEKFGIPRQSGLVPELEARIIFEPEFSNPDAVRGIEEYSHLWLLWNFSKAKQEKFTPLVSPPRLGGKEKKGVFATRSPFRPNSIGLSSVELKEVIYDKKLGPILIVKGADILDQTPIYDIKPYLPYTDSHPDAAGSFGELYKEEQIEVLFPEVYREMIPKELQERLLHVLMQDPRAAYNKKPDYVYGMNFAGYDIRFIVEGRILKVCDVVKNDLLSYKKVK